MKKQIWLVIILAIIIVILAGVLLLPNRGGNNSQSASGIQINSPKANEEVLSPLKITGTVKGDGWVGFEGQVGTVKLLDSRGTELATGTLTATTEWTTLPTNFETNLNFQSVFAQNGTLVFRNENPSGLPEKNKEFVLPVKIKASGETMTVKAYFSNNIMDPEVSCNKVFPVERKVLKTDATGTAALLELFSGPTEEEKKAGFFTNINEGVGLQSLMIGMESGTARADFNEQLEYKVSGSCKVTAIRAQITQTLKQFPEIKSVVISINGKTEGILQP